MQFDRFKFIEATPGILGGQPHIRDTRISVAHVLELLADGATPEDFAGGWPEVTPDVVREVLRFAANSVSNDILLLDPAV